MTFAVARGGTQICEQVLLRQIPNPWGLAITFAMVKLQKWRQASVFQEPGMRFCQCLLAVTF